MVKESNKSITRSCRSVFLHKYVYDSKTNQNTQVQIYLLAEQTECCKCKSIKFLSVNSSDKSIILPTLEPKEYTLDLSNIIVKWTGKISFDSNIIINFYVLKKLPLINLLKYKILYWTIPENMILNSNAISSNLSDLFNNRPKPIYYLRSNYKKLIEFNLEPTDDLNKLFNNLILK